MTIPSQHNFYFPTKWVGLPKETALNDSLRKLKVRFKEAQQERSKRTLDDLFEAAAVITESGDPDQFDARTLSKISGYSLGSLIKRLGKIENVFLYAIALGRGRQISKIERCLQELGPYVTPREFAETLADLAFRGIEKVNPAVIRYYESRAFRRSEDLAQVFAYTEEILNPLLRLIELNQSGCFRKLDRTEAKYICRAIFLFIERPYAENDPIAGKESHRQMVIDNISRLLSAGD